MTTHNQTHLKYILWCELMPWIYAVASSATASRAMFTLLLVLLGGCAGHPD
jgi:hypothetical protein